MHFAVVGCRLPGGGGHFKYYTTIQRERENTGSDVAAYTRQVVVNMLQPPTHKDERHEKDSKGQAFFFHFNTSHFLVDFPMLSFIFMQVNG